MNFLDVQNVSVRYGDLTIIKDVSFSLEEGQWLMIVGPNGAGKSTLINAIAQSVPYTGVIRFNGSDLRTLKSVELARRLGVLAQNYYVGYDFTVEEVIRLGRYAYAPGIFSKHDEEGSASVEAAMELTGLLPIAHQSVLTLSGGELQRTFLAQVFAQNPQLLILDEPTNHLDLVYQQQIFAILEDWLREKGRAIVSVVHDLSLARAFSTHALLMNKGCIAAYGDSQDVFSQEHLDRVYAIDVYAWMRGLLRQWDECEGDKTCEFC